MTSFPLGENAGAGGVLPMASVPALVPPAHIDEAFIRAWPLLSDVVDYPEEVLLGDLKGSNAYLWVIGDFKATAITRFISKPSELVLWVEWLAGTDMDDWLDEWIVEQESFAAANGCSAIEFQGRPGWERFRKKYSEYKPVSTIYRKDC